MSITLAQYRSSLILALLGIFGMYCGSTGPAREIRPALFDLVITEIHYNPLVVEVTDSGRYDFIEIKNVGNSYCDLSDVAITKGIEYTFTNGSGVEAGGFIVLASNASDFLRRYGFSPYDVYSKSLSNSGETITINDMLANQQSFVSVTYSDNYPWPEEADGDGYSLVPVTTDLNGDPQNSSFWRASLRIHGSPGADDPAMVYINEVLTHTDLPQTDAIELYNPNSVAVSIGGWYLTDKKSDPMKFRIPDGTVISAGGYIVFDESDFGDSTKIEHVSFRLNSHGEEVYLMADSTGCRFGACRGFSFGEIDNGVSFGRYVTSTGEMHFVAQKKTTLGMENAGPRVGPVVISKIMYHPPDGFVEYVAVVNITDKTVDLYDQSNTENTWRIDGIGFSFPPGVSLEPGETVLIASDSITSDQFKTMYNVNVNVQVFGKSQILSNSNGSITLMQPRDPYIDDISGEMIVPYKVIDEVTYYDGTPWPSEPDGQGASLERIDVGQYGNDPVNWKAGTASP